MISAQRLIVLLDSGPLGLVTHPKGGSEAQECQNWLADILLAGHIALVPEICYYEVRRELRRSEMQDGTPKPGLAKLDAFANSTGVVPITSEAILMATEMWAEARYKRIGGAPDLALDGDMILCAQSKLIEPDEWGVDGSEVVIATRNLKHLSHFASVRLWNDIDPQASSKT